MHIHVKKTHLMKKPFKMIKFHHDSVFQILVEREIKVEKNILTFLTKSKFKKAKKKKMIFTKKKKKTQRTLLYTIEARYKQISGGGGQKRIMY